MLTEFSFLRWTIAFTWLPYLNPFHHRFAKTWKKYTDNTKVSQRAFQQDNMLFCETDLLLRVDHRIVMKRNVFSIRGVWFGNQTFINVLPKKLDCHFQCINPSKYRFIAPSISVKGKSSTHFISHSLSNRCSESGKIPTHTLKAWKP